MRRFLATLVCLGILSAVAAVADDEVRDAIKKLKNSRNVEDRILGAELLRGRAQPEAVDALAQALQDKDAGVRQAAASALWGTGEKAKAAEPALRKALDDPEPAVVARVAGALEMMDVDAKELAPARRRALSAVKANDDHTAFLAARGLIGIDPPATVVPGLFPYLASMSKELEKPGGWSDYHQSVEAAEEAVVELAKTKDRRAIPLLLDELHRSPASTPSLLKALGAYQPQPEHFVQTLVEQMHARSARTRYAAVEQCRYLKSDADVAVWTPESPALLRDPDESIRSETLWALQTAKGRGAIAVPEIIRVLKEDSSVTLRARAAETLGEVGDSSQAVSQKIKLEVASEAKGPLTIAASDKNAEVAVNAVEAYGRLFLPTAESVNTLIQFAEGNGPSGSRQKALLYLRNLQGQAKPVLERVRALSKSSDKDIADDARAAAKWIEGGGEGTSPPIGIDSTASTKASAASGAEALGLAKLREMDLKFNDSEFARSLSDLNAEAIQAFLEAGMPAGHPLDGEPPLTFLIRSSGCSRGQSVEAARQIMKILLAAGADANQADENGNTALMFAAESCDRTTVRMLLSAGAKISTRNKTNENALEMSIFTGNPAVEELIAAGARLDPKKAKDYLEAYKNNPKAVALIKKATR